MDSLYLESNLNTLGGDSLNTNWLNTDRVDSLDKSSNVATLADMSIVGAASPGENPISTTGIINSQNADDISRLDRSVAKELSNLSFSNIDLALGTEDRGLKLTQEVSTRLKNFFSKDSYLTDLKTAFGDRLDANIAADIASQVDRNTLVLPVVTILSQAELNGAEGGFDRTNDKIYIAKEIVATGNIDTIARVAIEEIGHYFDTKLNIDDAPGDEGQIFENLVDGKAFTASQLAVMKGEDDTTSIVINGKATTIEKAEGDNGIYTVDRNGKIEIDFLADGGDYQNQMAIFSLNGMENLIPGSVQFIQEAARRALSFSTQGYVAISDAVDAGKFNLQPNTNRGKYQGRQDFNFNPGDKIALMMVPNGTIQEVFNNPNIGDDKRPLFSIDGANPGSFKQLAKVADTMLCWEDIRRDRASDADFNDLIFQINGTLATGAIDLKQTIAASITWQNTQICKDIEKYVAAETVNFFKPPVLTLALANDTGLSRTDGITKDPTAQLTIKQGGNLVDVTAQFLGNAKTLNLTNLLNSDGTLDLDRALLAQIAGGTLTDGAYELDISATDILGQKGSTKLKFTLDTIAPTKPTIALDVASDSGTIGDYRTNNNLVTLIGKADANTQLSIAEKNSLGIYLPIGTVTSDDSGNYTLAGVTLANGINNFTVQATDLAGNINTNSQDIRLIAKDDVIISWNQILLDAIATAKTPPPVASRAMAMVQTAVFDAVNNIAKKYKNYAITEIAPAETDPISIVIEEQAAAIQAAYTVLTSLFASQKATFDAKLTSSLAAITDGVAKTDGLTFGKTIADKVIASRANDGATTKVPYTPGTNPGDWQPTAVVTGADGKPVLDANGNTTPAPAVLPQWGKVTTFGILPGDVVNNRPAAPPALNSEQYAAEFNQVKDIGAANSTTRTADQTEIAKFWADGGGTFTPPGHWNQIAQDVARNQFNSLVDNARLFAALDVAEADAAIVCWDTKYNYSRWRPITAIRKADTDDNPATTADTTWTSLLTTPNFPAYTSGHSTFSSAAATVLTSLYGDNYQFSTTGPGLPGVIRNFTSFTQAAEEAGISRIYGGIHFMSDNTVGLAAGKKVGEYIAQNLFTLA
jgi:membrane-associated phospholipid phosphatase